MFLPTTQNELSKLNWKQLDIILVTGDTYIDSPFIGVALIGNVLLKAGYKVGIIAQPDCKSPHDITRLGEPKLFWGVTAGSLDSMVANYTALKKFRKSDDYTPGGENTRRPDRATIVYTNLIKQNFKNTKPIVIGGIEASLRRIAHYDFWSNKIRRSVLFDSKANILVYGMGEKAVLEIASALDSGQDISDIKGICYISKELKNGYIEVPSFNTVKKDKQQFINMFHTFYQNNDPITAKGLCQKTDTRYLIQNPPAFYLTQKELDDVYSLKFERKAHPHYAKEGKVKALDTIAFSISTHRGCYGECNFCAIAVHEGRTVRWRSESSIIKEAGSFTKDTDFKGIISDVGGPTANMYGFECVRKLQKGSCKNKRCLSPTICSQMNINHNKQITLLRKLRKIKGVRKVFVGSGIRYDMIQMDKKSGSNYLKELVEHHISGQMKIAPEHTENNVLKLMGKEGSGSLLRFKNDFFRFTKSAGKNQFLTYYLIAAHPGCTEKDMLRMNELFQSQFYINPEQVQIFTPTPSTYSGLMYYTKKNPFTGENIFVEKNFHHKTKQKQMIIEKKYSK